MISEIMALYAITNDLLKAIGHDGDCQVQAVSQRALMPKMLDKSRFNRRLHQSLLPLLDVFDYLGAVLKPSAVELLALSQVSSCCRTQWISA